MADPAPPAFFATTRWTIIRDAAHGGDTLALEALGSLVNTYWQPLYRYARRKGKSPEDAEDLVQGFLAHIIEANALLKTDPSKGRFRAFLLASFQNWMTNDWKRETRAKRGGGAAALSLDWRSAESGLHTEPADNQSPDKLYDREWALALLQKVLADLEKACLADDGYASFEALKPCLTADSARIPYADLAGKLQISEGAARVAVHRLRKRYRHLLTEEISRTLACSHAVEEEMRSLFAALAH